MGKFKCCLFASLITQHWMHSICNIKNVMATYNPHQNIDGHMPSLDFELEKSAFREFYDSNRQLLNDAKNSFIALVNALISHSGSILIAKIDGRVKEREECIQKFNLKYRTQLESKSEAYTISQHITDLIGLRIVCLYEDDIEKVSDCLSKHFSIIDKTDKISQIENTEGLFGYKGLHLDLKLNPERVVLPEYSVYEKFRFEVQIRTIIQDSWSVLDHKIKYKKSIPNDLKRRINTLAALFELADREFREIRDATLNAIAKEQAAGDISTPETATAQDNAPAESGRGGKLNAFSFQKIATHFFPGQDFEAYKVDGFTQEITRLDPGLSRGAFFEYLSQHIGRVKQYRSSFERENPADKLNPYTLIRHCLYLGDKEKFSSILTNIAKESFEQWLRTNRADSEIRS